MRGVFAWFGIAHNGEESHELLPAGGCQVFIPLVAGDTLDRDLAWYTLGRRNSRDRVSGRIRLATSWTATQLELMALNVAQKEQELAQLEELVAINREMMADREGGPQALVIQPPFRPLRLKSRKVRGAGKVALGLSRTMKKEDVGQLAVKVVEARHLSSVAAGGVPGLARTCDAYVVLGAQGALPKRTAVVHDSFFPVWNEAFVFDAVPQSASLTAQVRLLPNDAAASLQNGQAVKPKQSAFRSSCRALAVIARSLSYRSRFTTVHENVALILTIFFRSFCKSWILSCLPEPLPISSRSFADVPWARTCF